MAVNNLWLEIKLEVLKHGKSFETALSSDMNLHVAPQESFYFVWNFGNSAKGLTWLVVSKCYSK